MSSWQERWEAVLNCTCCLKVKVEVEERPKLDSSQVSKGQTSQPFLHPFGGSGPHRSLSFCQ